MKGGHFIWPDLHLGIDPSQCAGVVLFLWRGTHERHCTMTSEIIDADTIRYGSSIQINHRLLRSAVQASKAAKQQPNGKARKRAQAEGLDDYVAKYSRTK